MAGEIDDTVIMACIYVYVDARLDATEDSVVVGPKYACCMFEQMFVLSELDIATVQI